MDTVSLMGGDSDDDDDGVELVVSERRPQRWRMAPVLPKFLQRLRKRRSSSTIKANDPHRLGSNKNGASADQTTVAPSHSTNMSRLDDSYDSRDNHQQYHHTRSNRRTLLRRPRTFDTRSRGRDDEEIVFDEASSFAQQSLNTNTFEPAAFYQSHADGMEVILKNGVLSDATEYSWSPSPGDDDAIGGDDNLHIHKPIKSALPVEEICFFPDDDQYSSLIDGLDQGENIFSMIPGSGASIKEGVLAASSSSASWVADRQPVRVETFMNQQQQRQHLESSFHTFTSTSTRSTEHSKPSAAMIKRLSAFTGQDLLRQEADLFAQLLRLDDEKSKGTNKSRSSKKPRHPSRLLRSSESRLLAAIDAISDDGTLSKDRSTSVHHQSLMDNNSDDDDVDDHDALVEEDTTISTVTGSNIYYPPLPPRPEPVTTAILARVPNTSNYCGLFFSEPILTDVDIFHDNDEDDDEDYDDYSDLYSRPSTAGDSSSLRR